MATDRITLNQRQRFKIFELLRSHLKTIDPQKGTVRYDEGWSDARVAMAIGEGVTASHISRLRRDAVGDLEGGNGPKSKIEQRILRLEKAFNALAAELGRSNLRIDIGDAE